MKMSWKMRLNFVLEVVRMLGNLFTGVLSKILLATTLLFLSVAGLSTYLYLGTRDELTTLKSTYTQLKQEYTECSEAKDKVKISAEQDDTIILDKQEKIDSLTKEKDDLLSQLGKIPKKTCKATTQSPNIENSNEIEYVDIHAPFDDDFTRVLKQLDKDKRSGSVTP